MNVFSSKNRKSRYAVTPIVTTADTIMAVGPISHSACMNAPVTYQESQVTIDKSPVRRCKKWSAGEPQNRVPVRHTFEYPGTATRRVVQ